MPRVIDVAHYEPVLRAMVGAADVDGGPTDEQLAVIGALAAGYFEVDLDPKALDPLGPQATADAFPGPEPRRRVREVLVMIELCRHPMTAIQMECVEQYCDALDGSDRPGVTIVRDLVEQGWPTPRPTGCSSSATSASTRPAASTATERSSRSRAAWPAPAHPRRSRTRSGGERSALRTSRPSTISPSPTSRSRTSARRSASPPRAR